MERFCYLRHIPDLLADGITSYERRCDTPVRGPRIPFGSKTVYHQVPTEDKNRLQQFSSKVFQGNFVGYALSAGRGWTGDPFVADAEELRNDTPSEIHVKSFTEKEKGNRNAEGHLIFSCATGSVKLARDGPSRHRSHPS